MISVTPETFEQHVRWIASSTIAAVTLPELLRLPDDQDAVAITFDDAYTNFATEAWPRLEAHGLPVTLFVPTGFVGGANTWPELPGGRMPRLPILGWPALARLQERGVVLGAHTRTHPDLRALHGAALDAEIRGAFDDVMRETGQRPTTFAYPYGFWTAQAVSILRDACECACTTELRTLAPRDDAHLLPRLDTFYLNGPARIEKFGTRLFGGYLGVRRRVRGLAQRVRTPRA